MSETVISCWSCSTSMTLDELRGADSYCPECQVDIDLAEYYPELAEERDTLATRLAEAEAWLDEVATLCAMAERRVAELEEVIEQRNGECVSLHAKVAELEAGQESLILVRDDYKRQAGEYRKKWAELEARQGEAVHWRALLRIDQRPAMLNDKHVVGFTSLEAAESWVAEKKDFGGWDYVIEALYTDPPVAPEVAGLVEALSRLDSMPKKSGHAYPSNEQIRAEAAVIRAARQFAAYTQAKEPSHD